MVSLPIFRIARHPWYYWVIIVVGIELAWFGLLHPLVPTTLSGFIVEALLPIPVPVLLYASLTIWCITRLNANRSPLRQALSVVVAASLGVAIFAAAYFARGFLGAQFHYFILRH